MEIIISCSIPFFLIVLGLWYADTLWPNQFKITYIPFLDNKVGSFLFAAVVLLIPIVGCFTGFLLQAEMTSAFEISEDGWIVLKKPPEEIKTLRVSHFYTIYAETIDGRFLSCYYESVYDNDCWVEVSQLPEIRDSDNCYRWIISYPKPPSSVQVVDRIDMEDCVTFAGMDDRNTISYVLSDDNQVYQNIHGNPTYFSPPKLFQIQCLFSVVGLLIGLLIELVLMYINKKRNVIRAQLAIIRREDTGQFKSYFADKLR